MRAARFAIAALLLLLLTGATTSPNKGYTIPTPFADSNTWGGMLQGDLNILDQNLGGNCAVAISSPSTTATAAQAQCLVQKLTGTLTAPTNYVLPANQGGFWIVDNETTGAFTLTVVTAATGGGGFAPPQGGHAILYSDGTNILQAGPSALAPTGAAGGDLTGNYPNPTVARIQSNPVSNTAPATGQTMVWNGSQWAPTTGAVPAGAMFFYAATTPPSGYLIGDGSCVSATTYPNLGAILPQGGCSSGQVTLPDCRARMLAGYDAGNATGRLTGGAGVSASAIGNSGGIQSMTLALGNLPNLPIAINDPGHSHSTGMNFPVSVGLGGGSQTTVDGSGTARTSTEFTGITASISGTTDTAFTLVPPAIVEACIIRAS